MSKKILGGSDDRLRSYIRSMADRMGLRDWVLEIEITGDEMEEHAGFCAVYYGRQKAHIQIADDWPGWTPEGLRQTVAHELIHCHVQRITTAFDHVNGHLGPQAADIAGKHYRVAMEHAVDGIAAAWAKSLPLPGEAK